MQRILSILCIGSLMLLTHPKANAQEQLPEKKNLIGAGLSFSSGKSDVPTGSTFDGKYFSINTTITYAHYLRKNLALGVIVSYSHAKDGIFDYPTNVYVTKKSNAGYFAPFVRLDIPLWQSRFSIFNDLGISGSYTKNRTEYLTGDVKEDSWGLGAFYRPGLMFRLKSNISLQLAYGQLLSYNYLHNPGYSSHSFSLVNGDNLGDLQFGVNFLF
ncbi:porin family protein [Chitinophaga agrisoli]|uniref:Porin family protein n=1 Tax=Chitinophaga agrisoli TaxID=2607653 RepID=A0A5B2VW74_9BACT|nr:outer membrane beta-barrel protein [Chitinophaga agrisoli]KAA2242497.1 porin family protein [Chitinophaga agrisoli]